MANNLYDILGVATNATGDDIRGAYRKLARKYHPDVNPGDHEAEDEFKRVSAAYEVLSDQARRKAYDEFGEQSLKGGFDPEKARAYRSWQRTRSQGSQPFRDGGVDFDLADMFGFGAGARRRPAQARPGGARRAARGSDVHAVVTMDLRQAITGGEVKLEVDGRKSVTVRIPPGADNGSTIRIEGKGEPSPVGGAPGDLIIKTRVEAHPLLTRDGLDLYMKLPVTLDEAYNGATIPIPTFSGLAQVRVPPRSQAGDRLRVIGKGVPRKDRRGDLLVELEVRLPDTPDESLARALRKSRNAYSKPVREEIRL